MFGPACRLLPGWNGGHWDADLCLGHRSLHRAWLLAFEQGIYERGTTTRNFSAAISTSTGVWARISPSRVTSCEPARVLMVTPRACTWCMPGMPAVSYTHLRAHE